MGFRLLRAAPWALLKRPFRASDNPSPRFLRNSAERLLIFILYDQDDATLETQRRAGVAPVALIATGLNASGPIQKKRVAPAAPRFRKLSGN